MTKQMTFEEYKEFTGFKNHFTEEYKAAFKRLHGEDLDETLEKAARDEYDLYVKDAAEGWTKVK